MKINYNKSKWLFAFFILLLTNAMLLLPSCIFSSIRNDKYDTVASVSMPEHRAVDQLINSDGECFHLRYYISDGHYNSVINKIDGSMKIEHDGILSYLCTEKEIVYFMEGKPKGEDGYYLPGNDIYRLENGMLKHHETVFKGLKVIDYGEYENICLILIYDYNLYNLTIYYYNKKKIVGKMNIMGKEIESIKLRKNRLEYYVKGVGKQEYNFELDK